MKKTRSFPNHPRMKYSHLNAIQVFAFLGKRLHSAVVVESKMNYGSISEREPLLEESGEEDRRG